MSEIVGRPDFIKPPEVETPLYVRAFHETMSSVFGHIHKDDLIGNEGQLLTPEKDFEEIRDSVLKKIVPSDAIASADNLPIKFFETTINKKSEQSTIDAMAKENISEYIANTLVSMYAKSIAFESPSEQRMGKAICSGLYVMLHEAEVSQTYIEQFDGFIAEANLPQNVLDGFQRELEAFRSAEEIFSTS